MKSFINRIENSAYRCVGFDLDGTIYDEFDFVRQAFIPVSCVIAESILSDNRIIYGELCTEWLKYGSSGNIFQLVILKHCNNVDPELVHLCVNAFRHADFHLELSSRAVMTLDYLRNLDCKLFIVTDGNSILQRRKVDALQLTNWFSPENIVVSGDYGKGVQKPSTFMAGRVKSIEHDPGRVIYVGDRQCDSDFAHNCGFDFCYLRNMNLG